MQNSPYFFIQSDSVPYNYRQIGRRAFRVNMPIRMCATGYNWVYGSDSANAPASINQSPSFEERQSLFMCGCQGEIKRWRIRGPDRIRACCSPRNRRMWMIKQGKGSLRTASENVLLRNASVFPDAKNAAWYLWLSSASLDDQNILPCRFCFATGTNWDTIASIVRQRGGQPARAACWFQVRVPNVALLRFVHTVRTPTRGE